MNLPISKTSSFLYRFVVKPILFQISPDKIHADVIRFGSKVQKSRFLRWLVRSSWAYSNRSLEQDILGINFKNPVGLSAGFDKNVELAPTMKSVGFGFMEGGTITFQASKGNKRPWYHRLPKTKSLVVHAGLPSQGTKIIMKRVSSYPKDTFASFPLNISVAQSNVNGVDTVEKAVGDYLKGLKDIIASPKVSMITLNISCPNTYDGEPFSNPKSLEKLLTKIDGVKTNLPIFLKMPNHLAWKEFDALLQVASCHRVSGLIISNLVKWSDVKLKDVLSKDIRGGYSGKPTFELSNDLIFRTRKKYKDSFVIVGVGGIFSADDAYTKIKLGANLVELITGVIFEGPQLIGQINRGLMKRLRRDGFTSIDQAVGSEISVK